MKKKKRIRVVRFYKDIDEWLNTRGGRDRSDLKRDEDGYYILMFTPNGDELVPVPKGLK